MRPLPLALVSLLALTLVPNAAAEPVDVEVGILALTLGNYDVNKGTYVVDFYLMMRWDGDAAPTDFSPEKFEFMNGRASAKERIYNATDDETGMREVWYRIQANLYSEPDFSNFPYDTQSVNILLEDSVGNLSAMRYVPLTDWGGLDEDFTVAGWRVGEVVMVVEENDYKFEETYSRLSFTVELTRERLSTTLKTLLPPVAFVLVSGLSFFLHPSKVGNRLGLGTSMVISAVMFHISQTVALPPLGRLILFDKIMLAVYVFLVGSLMVTALIGIDEDYWKGSDHTRAINVWGAVATTVASGGLFVWLLM